MATLTDVTTLPASGYNHIDALLSDGPIWNWVTPARNTLYYSFSLTGGNSSDLGSTINGAPSAFNASQQASARAALSLVTSITGIQFQETGDGNAADVHFAAADLVGASTAGFCSSRWSYSYSGSTVTSFTADAWVYLDNVEFAASNATPTAGTSGYEVLLHELGHALGLKHPFEDGVRLPGAEDNTAYTLLSYTHVGGPYSSLSPYDIAALMFLYGGDGLGGALGHGAGGQYLVGTSNADALAGAAGNDVLEGKGANDTISGGGGTDMAVFSGNRAQYTWTSDSGGFTVVGPDGTDVVTGVEQFRFADTTVTVAGGVNSPPSGALTVTGTPRQGEVLGLTSTLDDADGLGTLSYRWESSPDGAVWSAISGATGSSFTPAQPQVGLRLRVVGSYTDGAGNAESVASTASVRVENTNDAPTGVVTLDGVAREGLTLSAAASLADVDGLGTVTLHWQASADGSTWTDIAGALGNSYTPTAAQVGLVVRALARYTDGQGTAEAVPSTASPTVLPANQPPTGSLSITGTAAQGQTLGVSSTLADADGLGAITLRWQSSANGKDWADIGGATGASLVLAEAQVGLLVRAAASYIDGRGSAESAFSAATAAVANVNDTPTGGVSLVGQAAQGATMRASSTLADADGMGPLTYRWQASADAVNWADIAGATASEFVPGQAQVGQRLRVHAGWVDGHGTTESATSPASTAVANINDAPTGSVTITGSLRQGQTLRVSQTLSDLDGLGTTSLQWQSSGDGLVWSDLGGAVADSFTPGQDQVGQRLRVLARYTDGLGTPESVASSATGIVANINDAPVGTISFSAAAKVGQPVVATVALSDLDGLGTLRYEWQQSLAGTTWQAITGATGTGFTPGPAQAGMLLRLMVRYTDGQGTPESVASTRLGPVLTIFNGTPSADKLTGSVLADELNGLGGDDTLTGGLGNDQIDGGSGLDTAVFPGPRSGYRVTAGADGTLTVQDLQDLVGTDTLSGVERLTFGDLALAFDLAGSAGIVARDLGAVFGREAVANARYAGIGLGLLDSGKTTPAELMQMALEARLGAGFDHPALVDLLYTNLVGAAPSASDRAYWVNTLEVGQFTPLSLALMAADLELNALNIDLIGLAQTGLAYT